MRDVVVVILWNDLSFYGLDWLMIESWRKQVLYDFPH